MNAPASGLLQDLPQEEISAKTLSLVPFDYVRRLRVFPLRATEDRLRLAMVNPEDTEALDFVRLLTGLEPDVAAVSEDALDRLIQKHYLENSSAHSPDLDVKLQRRGRDPGDAETHAGPVVEKLFRLALEQRASDIHLEPQSNALFVRFRVDGALRTIHAFPRDLQAVIGSRIKVLAAMDITERRLPQDGQIQFSHKGKMVDLRVSTLPAKYGEKFVIRLLDKGQLTLQLDALGLAPALQSAFEELIESPNGIILVTGPTGSGKTTTLYTVLNRIKSPLKNVVTFEDPIEYELLANCANEMGITQVQVNPKIGLTFASGLRAALRQDPDVIMLGEIRDFETAEIAMRASMTGHLVLSTLHTNNAVGTLNRLMDMKLEPHMIASTIRAVLAQRLIRLLCPHCRQPYRPPRRLLENLYPDRAKLDEGAFYRATGCWQCQGTGYHGRRGIFELLVVTDTVRESLLSSQPAEALLKTPEVQGLTTLRQSGLECVFRGLTTVEEVFRNTAA